MMDFVMLTIAIYVALVAATITVLMIGVSTWYTNKVKKMTKNYMKDFYEVDLFGGKEES